MARVFPEDSPMLDPKNPEESFDKIERYLRYMQERIEHMNNSKEKSDERQQEEISLVVKREGNIIEVNSDVIPSVSTITQLADRIALVVSSEGGTDTIKSAEIVAAINDSGSTVKISADHITLSGDVVLRSNLIDGSTQISGSNITTGEINAQNVNVTNIN